jgi:AP-1 complex subunit gamma-1
MVLNTPYVNTTSRQFVLTALVKVSGRSRTTEAPRQRIAQILESFSESFELETQQRAVEYSALFDSSLSELRTGVLEEMPPPEVKATVVGVGESYYQLIMNLFMLTIRTVSENKPVGPTVPVKDVSTSEAPGEGDVNPSPTRLPLLTLWGTKSQLHRYRRMELPRHQRERTRISSVRFSVGLQLTQDRLLPHR